MIPVHIGIATQAASTRKTGYIPAIMKVGQPFERFGEKYVWLKEEDYAAIRKEFATELSRKMVNGVDLPKGGFGLGDAIHAIAAPIGIGINKIAPGAIDCLKGDGTFDLKPGSPCAQRQAAMNAAGQKIVAPIRRAATAAKRLILPPR